MPSDSLPNFGSGQAGGDRGIGNHIEKKVQHAEDAALDRAQELRTHLEARIDNNRTRAADSVRRLGEAVRKTGDQLSEEDQSTQKVFDYAGERLDRAADYLATADPARLRRDMARFSREHPSVVIGGAAILGLAAGRLLRGISSEAGGEAVRESERDWGSAHAFDSPPRGSESDVSAGQDVTHEGNWS